jgi:hypothetical protein
MKLDHFTENTGKASNIILKPLRSRMQAFSVRPETTFGSKIETKNEQLGEREKSNTICHFKNDCEEKKLGWLELELRNSRGLISTSGRIHFKR